MADSRQKEATFSHGTSSQKDTGVGQQSAFNDPDAQGEQTTAQDGPTSRIVLERGISAHMQQTISQDVAGSPRNTLPLCTAPPSTQVSHDQASNGYFANRALHSTPSRKSLRMPNGSTQSSSGSLQTLAEHEGADGEAYRSVQRAASTRLPHSPKMGRRHSKSASMSQPVTMFPTQATRQGFVPGPHPGFPDQTYASLSPDPTFSSRPNPSRSRSSHATSEMARLHAASNRESAGLSPFSRTEHSTPLVSPGLFSPVAMRAGNNLEHDAYRSASPQLHHLQVPKETHAAEIDHDMISGNKMVNAYEIIRELGRGEHGKVKLGRDNVHDLYVAIKIVARFSNKNRRLGRLDEPQDQTRREVAILKRARHPNVVSLIEVIDDPSKKKVYLILEYVERGEIKWRKRGVPQICKINNARFESEKSKGISLTLDPSEHDRWLVKSAAIKHDALDRQRQNLPHQSSVWHFAGDVDEENELERTASQAPSTRNTDSAGPSRSQSEDDYALHPTQSLAGSMYGPYMDEVPNHRQDRKYSLAVSHMSSEFDFEESMPEMSYVPALTQDEARRAFRDTLLGLEFLHAIGIIHRDIKPSNLLVASDGAVKISDFGVSYFGRPMTEQEAEAKGNAEKEDKPLDDERELARSVGTQAFWAPELCYEDPDVFIDGKVPKITGAIDLWALGVTLYAMVYARLPFYATETLGLHAAVCTTDVTLPKTRLVPVDTTNEAHVTHSSTPINSNKRLDFELKFETVPDNLRDLMAKLLTRDPANRITIAQAKQHPWVLENIPDVTQFLEPPNVVAEGGDTNITEPDEKDIKEAVVKRSFLGDMARTATKAINSLFKQTSSGRRRGNTLSTNTPASTSSESIASPAGSSTSTVGKQERGRDARRTSLPPDELLSALHRSREVSGHPLAQSQTASPDNEEIKFDLPEQTSHPDFSPAVSPRIAPSEARPKLPDRGLSALSTADSTRTIRPSQGHSHGMLDVPGGTPPPFDAVLTGKLQNWWENTKTLTRLASRDRRARDLSRSPSMSRASSESEPRPAQPTLAISHTQATGTMETPDALKLYDTDSRQGSQSEDNKIGSSASSTTDLYHRAPTSAPSAFLEAQEINQRRLIREAQEEAALSQTQSDSAYLMKSPAECPPSPDDLRQDPFRAVQTTSSVPPFTQEFEHNILSTTASSVEDFTNSSVTQSTSNPSFIATSGASSPPEEAEPFLSKEYTSHYAVDHTTDPDYLRTEDTIIEHGRPRAHTTPGKAVEQQESDYHDEGDDENSSDEDDAVLMMGPKKKNAV